MKYVALLRGINVGGKNKVDMKQLKAALEQAGFKDVSTYINSGNIFFTDDKQEPDILRSKVEQVVAEGFGLNIRLLVVDQPTINKITAAIPSNWTNDASTKCDVIFLWQKYNTKAVLDQLTIKPDIDNIIYVPGALIWCVNKKLVTRSGLMKIVGSELYAHVTIRNCNTTRKIQQIMAA